MTESIYLLSTSTFSKTLQYINIFEHFYKVLMATETTANEFSIMEKEDEMQIVNADAAFKNALVYKVKDKVELSYVGLKTLVLLMSQKGQPLEIADYKMELIGDKPEEKIWYATVKVKNIKTGYESLGMSEQSYYQKDKNGAITEYDPFGRTKALSKAERNAWRKQIPEVEIKMLVQDALGKGEVKELHKTSDKCTCEAGKRNWSQGKCSTCGKPVP